MACHFQHALNAKVDTLFMVRLLSRPVGKSLVYAFNEASFPADGPLLFQRDRPTKLSFYHLTGLSKDRTRRAGTASSPEVGYPTASAPEKPLRPAFLFKSCSGVYPSVAKRAFKPDKNHPAHRQNLIRSCLTVL